MFGEYVRNLDSKNRIAMPSKLRDDLGAELVLTIGMDNNLELRSKTEFEKLVLIFNARGPFDKQSRLLKRKWLGSSCEIELDSQGRFIMPKNFLDASTIQKEVVFVGVGDLVEIWSKDKYEDYKNNLSDEEVDQAIEYLQKGSNE
ncbi:division/cell wall cluster transcriptional repressor MraZ [Mycoplasma sp. Mirounga ES2805-ORL]|uniref:division/cell wall cluster transcriptional repressor MraZ n=1 Tax=Mycoplasma sp. Mirounga ES2805-ORL TaxID=754514 RepID=UPI00197B21F4|nr:division/cell wall cluster transcriptional repressor MraZ [Mycoplasma sp. Mirounga ES2805-ORL]QSF13821.1 division/cell wall cluster transcriptional repressor MraZ [Mycoplasma sp. Mirounga ES2805-ORL]